MFLFGNKEIVDMLLICLWLLQFTALCLKLKTTRHLVWTYAYVCVTFRSCLVLNTSIDLFMIAATFCSFLVLNTSIDLFITSATFYSALVLNTSTDLFITSTTYCSLFEIKD